MEICDVCIVYVFVDLIGKYGGDVDNWMWFCYMGDFFFYCVYVGKDGKFVDYSEENVLFKFDYFLKVLVVGFEDGDFVMVVGYFGFINCYVCLL